MLKSCPSYAQTEVQVVQRGDGSLAVRHDRLSQAAHKGLCLALALQAMSQKLMLNKTASYTRTRPVSVHDAGAVDVSGELAIAIIGEPACLLGQHQSLLPFPLSCVHQRLLHRALSL